MGEKHCFLKCEMAYNNPSYVISAIEINEAGKSQWEKKISFSAKEVEGHYVIIKSDEFRTSIGEPKLSHFILAVKHNYDAAQNYCFERCRKLAIETASRLECELVDYIPENSFLQLKLF